MRKGVRQGSEEEGRGGEGVCAVFSAPLRSGLFLSPCPSALWARAVVVLDCQTCVEIRVELETCVEIRGEQARHESAASPRGPKQPLRAPSLQHNRVQLGCNAARDHVLETSRLEHRVP
eukprot:65853-Rhodomonas_salina.1